MKNDIQKKLAQLLTELNNSMGPKSTEPIKLTRSKSLAHANVKSVEDLAGALEDLRLGIKYILFDLEATKRENSYLKERINDLS